MKTRYLLAVVLLLAGFVRADVETTAVPVTVGGGGGGAASAVTPNSTTVTGCQNRVLYGDNSSVLNCEAAFGYVTATNTLTADTAAFSTLLTIPAGTTAATGTLLANDTDTWIGSVTGGNISFYTNNTERYRMDSAGNLAIASGVSLGALATQDISIRRHAASVAAIHSSVAGTSVRYFMGGGAAVASATALPAPTGSLFHVTGTTVITSITTTNLGTGACFTMIFDGITTVTDGSNLVLAGNFVTTADDTLSVCFDGTNFYETARAVN